MEAPMESCLTIGIDTGGGHRVDTAMNITTGSHSILGSGVVELGAGGGSVVA